jgi:hypothetical protein
VILVFEAGTGVSHRKHLVSPSRSDPLQFAHLVIIKTTPDPA